MELYNQYDELKGAVINGRTERRKERPNEEGKADTRNRGKDTS